MQYCFHLLFPRPSRFVLVDNISLSVIIDMLVMFSRENEIPADSSASIPLLLLMDKPPSRQVGYKPADPAVLYCPITWLNPFAGWYAETSGLSEMIEYALSISKCELTP